MDDVTRSSLGADIAVQVRTYLPQGDAPSHRRAIDLLVSVEESLYRSAFDPGHFTASGFVLSPDRSSMLLIRHGKLDRWLQPGGHFERDDASVEAAARREIVEETSVARIERLGAGLVRIDAHEIPPYGEEPAHVHVDLGVGFRAITDDIGALDEVVDARWVGFGELERYDVDAAVMGGALALQRLASTDP